MKTTNNNSFTATAYCYTTTLEALLKSYKTASQLKKDYKSLVNLYGQDEAVRLMKGYKSARAGEVQAVAEQVTGNLTVSGLMNYAFKELKKGGNKNGALARLQSVYGQTSAVMDWEGFLAKYYPQTMEGGKPATAVMYTRNGGEIYKVYEPLAITTENSVKILLKALASLDKGARRVYVNQKPRLAWTEVHKAGEICTAYKSTIVHEVLKDSEGNVVSDKYKIEKGEAVEFPEGLRLTEEFVTVKEFTAQLNSKE